MKGFIRSNDGTALVELALALPVLVYLLIGMIDVGRYAYYGIIAAHAVRSGLQYGTQNVLSAANSAGINAATLTDAQNMPAFSVTTTYFCTVNGATADCASGVPNLVYFVQVRVTGTIAPLLDYPGVPSHVPITSTGVMRVANQ